MTPLHRIKSPTLYTPYIILFFSYDTESIFKADNFYMSLRIDFIEANSLDSL